MGRHVDRKFIVFFFIHSYYLDRQKHYFSSCCFKCKHRDNILHEIDRWSFYDLNQGHNKWFVIFHKNFDSEITIFSVFI